MIDDFKFPPKRKIAFIGDVHAKFIEFGELIENEGEVIQVGDFGLGFDPNKDILVNDLPSRVKFIRGNHDNPQVCYKHPNYLGNYGFVDGIFFMSGAYSIDKAWRTEGFDWWPDEELSMEESYKAIELYERVKPRVVVSHSCPDFIQDQLFDFQPYPNRTGQVLQSMLTLHTPEIHIFGHYHMSRDRVIEGCRYICLNELEKKEVEI